MAEEQYSTDMTDTESNYNVQSTHNTKVITTDSCIMHIAKQKSSDEDIGGKITTNLVSGMLDIINTHIAMVKAYVQYNVVSIMDVLTNTRLIIDDFTGN